jgi:4-O-beta-D-mannosyl-D-glucose phosphorylase
VARTSIKRLLDYAMNTQPDPLRSPLAVEQRCQMIQKNLQWTRKGRR